jgi:hypothetical protein
MTGSGADPDATAAHRQRGRQPDQQQDGGGQRHLLAGIGGDLEVREPGHPVEGEAALPARQGHALPEAQRPGQRPPADPHLAEIALVEGVHRLRGAVVEAEVPGVGGEEGPRVEGVGED